MDIENWKDVVHDRDGCRDIVVADKTLRVDSKGKKKIMYRYNLTQDEVCLNINLECDLCDILEKRLLVTESSVQKCAQHYEPPTRDHYVVGVEWRNSSYTVQLVSTVVEGLFFAFLSNLIMFKSIGYYRVGVLAFSILVIQENVRLGSYIFEHSRSIIFVDCRRLTFLIVKKTTLFEKIQRKDLPFTRIYSGEMQSSNSSWHPTHDGEPHCYQVVLEVELGGH
ncbi:hypothetical protein AGLY_004269 [Aphis glycines]|uniref:Uncharacterized protein n=1 Tax=Aphis glycines TaxID=307491 RepID=A0A6G0TY38_APHGL|nr:hypothetical protein AGLY_004269 [Aphis glycines]